MDFVSLNRKFGLSDSEIEKVKEESNEVQFYGNKVKDFNEEELRIAIGCLTRIINFEQARLLKIILFTQTTLETSNFKGSKYDPMSKM